MRASLKSTWHVYGPFLRRFLVYDPLHHRPPLSSSFILFLPNRSANVYEQLELKKQPRSFINKLQFETRSLFVANNKLLLIICFFFALAQYNYIYLYVSSNVYSFFFVSFLNLSTLKRFFSDSCEYFHFNIIFLFPFNRKNTFFFSFRPETCIDPPAEVKRATLIVPSLHSHVAKSHIWKEGYACDDAQVPTLS